MPCLHAGRFPATICLLMASSTFFHMQAIILLSCVLHFNWPAEAMRAEKRVAEDTARDVARDARLAAAAAAASADTHHRIHQSPSHATQSRVQAIQAQEAYVQSHRLSVEASMPVSPEDSEAAMEGRDADSEGADSTSAADAEDNALMQDACTTQHARLHLGQDTRHGVHEPSVNTHHAV